jgi:RNA polymerase-interacting CarD/CdnL/TRCF family regulator
MSEKIAFKAGDLLYHPVHGLCRIREIVKQNGSSKGEASYYALVPKLVSKMGVRFLVATNAVEESGFHSPLVPKEAKEILDYLKEGEETVDAMSGNQNKGARAFAQSDGAWAFAKAILVSSRDKQEDKKQRTYQLVERAAKGLVHELAFVLEITAKQAAEKVKKSLGHGVRVNPSVLAILAHIS